VTSPACAPAVIGHSWLPRTTCDSGCVGLRAVTESRLRTALRVTLRLVLALLLAPGLPLLALPLPGQTHVQRIYCRLVLRCCFGIRIVVSGSPIRNLRGVLVVSPHISWLDVFTIGSVLPGSFVARADMFAGFASGIVARGLKVIPIERASLRRLPAVVQTVAQRLREGQTVVAFPEGTTWCGRHGTQAVDGDGAHRGSGKFYPAMFQAAIDAGRPVQPVRLTYHRPDGSLSTAPAFVGDDTLPRSISRMLTERRTLARVHVESLQLPTDDRRDLARRCQAAVGVGALQRRTRRRTRRRVLVAS
jgi:1-acyl-sn-glycerol-3-phosphate acyltransferase